MLFQADFLENACIWFIISIWLFFFTHGVLMEEEMGTSTYWWNLSSHIYKNGPLSFLFFSLLVMPKNAKCYIFFFQIIRSWFYPDHILWGLPMRPDILGFLEVIVPTCSSCYWCQVLPLVNVGWFWKAKQSHLIRT